jgi:hypothetical protein
MFVICGQLSIVVNTSLLTISASILTVVSQEFKRINEDVQHILKYFHGKSGSILPYALQVQYSTRVELHYRLQIIEHKIRTLRFIHRPCFGSIVYISTSVVELIIALIIIISEC